MQIPEMGIYPFFTQNYWNVFLKENVQILILNW